jgi:hypothetical protein
MIKIGDHYGLELGSILDLHGLEKHADDASYQPVM